MFSDNIDQKREHVVCDLCGFDDYKTLFNKNGFIHVECRHCGLVYVTPRLSMHLEHQKEVFDGLSSSFDNLDSQAHDDYSGSRKKRLLKESSLYEEYNLNGRILDIGCGLGGFLRSSAENGWRHPEGVEIAPRAANYTSRSFPVSNRPFEELSYDHTFDVIRLNNVIEHLSSPLKLVKSVARNLRTGGLFVVSTPNFKSLSVKLCREKWQYIGGDDHIYLFTPDTLKRMLEDNGFKVIRVKTKGVHLVPKDHSRRNKSQPYKLLNSLLRRLELIVDLFVRRTLWGHRLKIWAVKL